MKSMTKRTGAMLAIAAYTTVTVAGMGLFAVKSANAASAADDGKEGLTYFYEELRNSEMAERFYGAFQTLVTDGSFKKNEIDVNLVEKQVVSAVDVQNYVDKGGSKLPVAFGAGRDAFLMDNPDLFYADVFGVSLSAGAQAGNYVAYLDNSRVDTVYINKNMDENFIDNAIQTYETKLNEIVAAAKAVDGVKEQIEFVNSYLVENTEYSFCNDALTGEALPEADFINTSYGSIVNHKAVCGGYAKGFKAVLDRLEIPCVLVQGYSLASGSSTYQPHMWNAVKLEGMWYAVDVTWNDTTGKNNWLLVGEQVMNEQHVSDGVVSSSGFELKYPALKPYNYGVDTDSNGMNINGEYTDSTDGTGKKLKLEVVYDGKGAQKLADSGNYLAIRLGNKNENGQIDWTVWYEAVSISKYFMGFINFTDVKTDIYVFPQTEYVQVALIDYAPDVVPEINGSPAIDPDTGKPHYCMYSYENLTDEHISRISAPYCNEGYGSYIPAPAPVSVKPHNGGNLKVEQTYDVEIKFSDKLILADGKTESEVKLNVSAERGNDGLENYIKVENFKWDGDRTISFRFTPSQMYIHNLAAYYFYPENLVGEKSGKIPEPATFTFTRKSVVCSKIFNDGRLYMNVYGEPRMLDTADLSTNGFIDENGHHYAENQRSQLLLVANKPSDTQDKEMKDALSDNSLNPNPVGNGDVVRSATYEIHLQICGVVQKVPDGSYMQVAFGFPEGFSPDDKGTTFKIYHYTHDEKGNIKGVEEIPVIVTEYGLIAQVKSFSPFTVAQVKKSAADEQIKSIYASVDGMGGTLTYNGKSGITQVEGEEITYNITPAEGYQLDSVKLNGVQLPADRFANGALTLTKAELSANNTLEASFVTVKSAENYSEKGVELKRPDTIVVESSDMLQAFVPEVPDVSVGGANNTPAIIVIATSLAIVALTVVAAVVIVKRDTN